jgi:hypothetical protein
MNRFAASDLASKLKENYHYIFTGMGEKILGEDTSFFVAFRGELQAAPEYIPFENQNLMMERGFFVMETKDRIYVSTYRPNANDWSEIFARDFKDKQVVLMGEMDPEDAPLLIEQGFVSKTPPGTELKTSLTYEHYHGTEEGLDTYEPFFYVKNIENMADVVPMHSEEKLSEALSDHALILHR